MPLQLDHYRFVRGVSLRKINFFIVGAAKAGTSSLWSALRQHPAVFAPADELNKEPSFFTPIANHIGLEHYHELYADATMEQYLMDASTPYLTHPRAAQAIHDYNPNAKIIIILRNPVDRAYSLYLWMVAEGYEWAPSFESALGFEEERAVQPTDRNSMPQYFWNYMYRRSGLFYEQVLRYKTLFGSNVLLVNFHEMITQPAVEINRIQGFLGLERFNLTLQRENPSMQVISPRLSFAARRLQERISRRLPSSFQRTKRSRDFILSLCTTKRRPERIKPETREKLNRYFAGDLEKLRKRYGIDLKQAQHYPKTNNNLTTT